jgi:hypothetical protein
MMRGIAACVTTCIGLALMPVAAIGEERVPPAPPATAPLNSADGITLDAHQKDIVDKVSSYFSGINTLQGSFLQTGDAGARRSRRMIPLPVAPVRPMPPSAVLEPVAERAIRPAEAAVPLQQLCIERIGRTAGECVHARMLQIHGWSP